MDTRHSTLDAFDRRAAAESRNTMVQYLRADRFVSRERRSRLYDEAVEAMARLVMAEGWSRGSRAAAEALSNPVYAAFLEETGFSASSRPCIQRLAGRKQCGQTRGPDFTCQCQPPGDDHGMLFLKDRQPAVYVSQPYDLCLPTLREIVAFCTENRLTATVRGLWSWHFPGHTVSVFYRRLREDEARPR